MPSSLVRLLLAVALSCFGAAFVVAPGSASAGSPASLSLTPGQSASYTGTVAPGWADPSGPPAPGCTQAGGTPQCDRETVAIARGSSPASDTLALQFYVTYAASDPGTAQNCPDLAILDQTGDVLAQKQCAASGASNFIQAASLDPGTYVLEVDDNGTDVAGLTPQDFTGTAALVAVSAGDIPAPTQLAPTFTHEITVDPNRANGEPDLAISDNGREMYTSGPWGFSTTVSMAWKSNDGGVQWDLLHGSCPANPLRPFCSRGGGDTEVQLGSPQSNGEQTVHFVDLNGLDTLSCAYSTNGGQSFTVTGGGSTPANPAGPQGQVCNAAAGPDAPGSDRQWIAIWRGADNGTDVDKLFMVYDTGDSPSGGDDAVMSLDGGKSWTTGCRTLAPGSASTTSCVGGPNGYGSRPGPLVINPKVINTVGGTTWPTLYEFMATSGNGPEVNISCDGGKTWSHKSIAGGPGGLGITNDFVVGAVDSAGRLYAAWAQQSSDAAGEWQTKYAYSTDTAGTASVGNCTNAIQGATWSTPITMTGQGSAAPNVHYAVMPAIAVGDPGRVDLAYYGSSDPLGTNPAAAGSMKWYLRMEQSVNGADAQPNFVDTQVSEQPMHAHSICFSGLSCAYPLSSPGGDRNLADFFEIKPDPSGRAVITYVDDNNSQPGPPAPAGTPGAGLISSVQQATGASLFARVGTVPPLGNGLSQSTDTRFAADDPAGDALLPGNQPAPGSNVDAADLTGLSVAKDAHSGDLLLTFHVKDLSKGLGSAVVNNAATAAAGETNSGATWVATWHYGNDLWFAAADADAAGNVSYIAGRPLDAFSSSAPKALEYVLDPQGQINKTVTGTVTGNTITIDVPASLVGNPDQLSGLTGFTADTQTLTMHGATNGTAPGSADGQVGFWNNIDQTAPIDASFAPSANVPESPAAAILLVVGGCSFAVAMWMRTRRRRVIAG